MALQSASLVMLWWLKLSKGRIKQTHGKQHKQCLFPAEAVWIQHLRRTLNYCGLEAGWVWDNCSSLSDTCFQSIYYWLLSEMRCWVPVLIKYDRSYLLDMKSPWIQRNYCLQNRSKIPKASCPRSLAYGWFEFKKRTTEKGRINAKYLAAVYSVFSRHKLSLPWPALPSSS